MAGVHSAVLAEYAAKTERAITGVDRLTIIFQERRAVDANHATRYS